MRERLIDDLHTKLVKMHEADRSFPLRSRDYIEEKIAEAADLLPAEVTNQIGEVVDDPESYLAMVMKEVSWKDDVIEQFKARVRDDFPSRDEEPSGRLPSKAATKRQNEESYLDYKETQLKELKELLDKYPAELLSEVGVNFTDQTNQLDELNQQLDQFKKGSEAEKRRMISDSERLRKELADKDELIRSLDQSVANNEAPAAQKILNRAINLGEAERSKRRLTQKEEDRLTGQQKLSIKYNIQEKAQKQGVVLDLDKLQKTIDELWIRYGAIGLEPFIEIPKDLTNWDWRNDPLKKDHPPPKSSNQVNILITSLRAQVRDRDNQISNLSKPDSLYMAERDRAEREREKVQEKLYLTEQAKRNLEIELERERNKPAQIIEKEKIIYKEAPKREPQPKPKVEVKEEGIWTRDFISELSDIYNDYLLTQGVSPKGKTASFNVLIRDLKTEPDINKENIRELVREKAKEIAENFPGKKEKSMLSKLKGFEPAAPESRGREVKTGADFGTDEGLEAQGPEGGGGGYIFKARESRTRRQGKTPRWPSRLTGEELDYFYPIWDTSTYPYGSRNELKKWFEWETWVDFASAQKGFDELVAKVTNDKDVDPLWVDEYGKEHYVGRELVASTVGSLIEGTWYPNTPVDETIIHVLRILSFDKKPFNVSIILETLHMNGYEYSEVDVRRAIKNAYYQNKDAELKGEQKPYIGLYLTKPQYEEILGENIPDKPT